MFLSRPSDGSEGVEKVIKARFWLGGTGWQAAGLMGADITRDRISEMIFHWQPFHLTGFASESRENRISGDRNNGLLLYS